MRDSSSWFTSLTAADAVSGVVSEPAIVPAFRVGPSHLFNGGRHLKLIAGTPAGGDGIFRHLMQARVTGSVGNWTGLLCGGAGDRPSQTWAKPG